MATVERDDNLKRSDVGAALLRGRLHEAGSDSYSALVLREATSEQRSACRLHDGGGPDRSPFSEAGSPLGQRCLERQVF